MKISALPPIRNFRNPILRVFTLAAILPGLALFSTGLQANPRGANVAAGNVNFQGMGSARLDINNLSQKAIINWQSFSIDRGEVTRINQAGNAITLNRVVSGNPTEIFGTLKAANGGVVVVNPNGIVVGQGGTIDVAGMLTMSTLDVTNRDFLNGGADRYRGTTAAGLQNYGTISSESGDVVLMGNFLQNAGEVNATRGVVAFGAGGDMVVDHGGGATISVRSGGAGGNVGIDNSGTVNAAAAELSAHGNVYALAIQNTGVVRASGYNFKGGKLSLSAGSGGRIVNTGTLQARNANGSGGQVMISGGQVDINAGRVDASGAAGQVGGNVSISGSGVNVAAGATVTAVGSTGGTVSIASSGLTSVNGSVAASGNSAGGGRVTVEGSDVLVGSQAVVDVSGQTAGGTAMIGGGFQGKDAGIANAENLTVETGSLIIADAVGSGKGGNIILWSDGDTLFDGDLSARGINGGGFAEISGKSTLEVNGGVDLTTVSGAGGTLLLDPTDITISALGAGALGGSTISNLYISSQLDAGTNVVISTNIGGTQAGNITVGRLDSTINAAADQIEWYQNSATTIGGTLSLLAMGDIRFNSAVHSAGQGGVNVVAGWDGTTGLTMGAFDMTPVLATMNDGNVANDAAGRFNSVNGSYGSVFIGGTGTQAGVDVGSRWGDTNLAARDLFLTGSILRGRAWAQLGFSDSGVEYELSRVHNGLVINEWWGNTAGNVLGKDYIALLGGTEFGTGDTNTLGLKAFRGAGWGATGDITVGLSGRLDARSGNTASFTQIGHGGILGDGTEWKRGQNFKGDSAVDYIQVTRDGIEIDPGYDRRSFFSSTWRTNYAGDAARIVGNISVEAAGDILIMAAPGFDAGDNLDISVAERIYTMIGHGGSENLGSYHGDISVIAHGKTPGGFLRGPEGLGIQVIGGRSSFSSAMIGHGSTFERNPQSIWDQTLSGDINVTATTGAIRLLGHNQAIRVGDLNFGPLVPEGTPTPVGNASDENRRHSFVQIGHGGQAEDFPLAALGFFKMPGGTNVNNIIPNSSINGELNVFAGGTFVDPQDPTTDIGIQIRAGNRRSFFAMIGHGGSGKKADHTGTQTPNFGPTAQLPFGQQTVAAPTGFHGNIRVVADKGSVIAKGADSFRSTAEWSIGYSFAQIGHGGYVVRGPKGGTITVLAGQGAGAKAGDILFQAGRMVETHAMLGHGGFDSDSPLVGGWNATTGLATLGANTAKITVTARGSISFVSPPSMETDALGLSADYAYYWYNGGSATGIPRSPNASGFWETNDRFVQLGHGGYASTTVMPDKQDIIVTSGTGDMANADRNDSTGGITFIAGDSTRDYAQLGHGGHSASAGTDNIVGFTGDIIVTANGGGVRFDGSIFGAQSMARVTDVSRNGIDTVQPPYLNTNGTTTTGHLVRGAGVGQEAYAQLGHGGYGARGVHSGDIVVNAWGGVDFLAAPAAPKIGRTVTNAPINAALGAGTNVWVALGNFVDTQVVNTPATNQYQQPEKFSNVVPGSVKIELSNGKIITDLPNASSDDRTSLLVLDGVRVGEINYDNGLVRFQVGGVAGAIQTGLTTEAVATFQNAQGLKERAYVQLGHGGYDSDGPNNKANDLPSMSGNITIGAAGDVRFQGGAAYRNYAQLGHGGLDVKGVKSGNISIDHVDADHFVGGIRFTAGVGGHRQYDYQNYAQLGHGGYEADGNMFGNIYVRGTKDAQGVGLLFKAGDRQDASVQMGHGGVNADSGTGDGALTFGMNGDIDVQVGGTVAFVAGTMRNNNPLYDEDGRLSAQLGHGGYDADPSTTNNPNLTSKNVSGLPAGTAGAGEGNWGHFGDIKLVTTAGDISFMAGSNIPVANRLDYDGNPLQISDPLGLLTSNGGGYGRIHWAQAGHGGYSVGGNHEGDITIVAEKGGVNVVGGMYTTEASATRLHYAQIGHGSSNANTTTPSGNLSGDIKVHGLGGNIVVVAGEALTNNAQIGHGGPHNATITGNLTGDISVIARNNLQLNSGNADLATNWGKIGHGDVRNVTVGSSVWNGDIHVSVGNTLTMGRALIGHFDFQIAPSEVLRSTQGDTFIAVGRNNPYAGGSGQFITTDRSVITAAGAGIFGELRLYMPDYTSNKIAGGTYLSSTNYTRNPAPGSGRADEHIAREHAFPASGMTEADATFTPEGPYPAQSFGLYNIYYGSETPFVPEPSAPPTPPRPPSPPGPIGPDFGGFFYGDTFDAYDRDDRFLGDGLTGAGDELYYNLGLIEDDEDDEEALRRKRARGKQAPVASTYYVYDPSTNRYSSYRVFGVPSGDIPRLSDPR